MKGIPTRVIGTCFYEEAREAAGILATVFSFVMAYNNKKVGAILLCVQTQYL